MHKTDLAQAASEGEQVFKERHRPTYHYSPRRNWMNDPNGLVWFEGEYHLFYQYNPHGIDWGHMSWGHAVSNDLVHWQELPVAIPEGKAMIFSGSAIVDHDNVSGLGDGVNPPIIAFYTEHFPEPGRIERQSLAYSHDRGRTFKQYAGNPLIDIGCSNFRDPKVFFHAPSNAWIMIVALSQDHVVHFYRSKNLLDWHFASTFGPAGCVAGQWECADIFFCTVKGSPGDGRWVLKVDVDDGIVAGGSGSQYFVGFFDGHCFTPDTSCGGDRAKTVDCGPDFYASASWSNLPEEHSAPLFLAWMSNQQSGRFYPTSPWRGVMSVPRSLYLFAAGGELMLGQTPVESLTALTGITASSSGQSLQDGTRVSIGTGMESADVQFGVTIRTGCVFTLEIGDATRTLLRIELDELDGMVRFNRLPDDAISPDYARSSMSALDFSNEITFRVLIDRSTIEIFLNDGEVVYSSCLFPEDALALNASTSGGIAEITFVTSRRLSVDSR